MSFYSHISCTLSFYTDIRHATESNEWLKFKQTIPNLPLDKLYIRDSYRTMASRIHSETKKILITGTPGIGKSQFMFYLLWTLVKERKRVLFIYHPFQIYYDGKGNVFTLNNLPEKTNDSFWNNTLWCLFDSRSKNSGHLEQLGFKKCHSVLSTSPRREIVNYFKEEVEPQIFYMPIWTKTEMETIAPLYPHATEWNTRFLMLGGVPRYVLEYTTKSPTRILQDACTDNDFDTIMEMPWAPQSLIHTISSPPYTEYSIGYASNAAFAMIIKYKKIEAMVKMEKLLLSSANNPLKTVLCEYINEWHALKSLQRGGSFTCRQLMNDNSITEETIITIPSSFITVVDQILPHQTKHQLHVPKRKNVTFDAWIPGIGAFQMTVGKNHDIKTKEDLAKLGPEANKLFWLIPPLYYSQFTKKLPQEIDQYAILIPYFQ